MNKFKIKKKVKVVKKVNKKKNKILIYNQKMNKIWNSMSNYYKIHNLQIINKT